MNHDYTHCADFTETCPRKCFRAELERDLYPGGIWRNKAAKLGPMMAGYAHLKGTDYCSRGKRKVN